jgi:GT2 family glycosyltransferase
LSNLKIAEGCRGRVVFANDKIDEESDVFILGSEDNLGFARGNNLGATFLLKHFKLDYLLISNCDLVFLDNDVIDKLISKMDDTPDIGLIGPCIVTPSGDRLSPMNNLSVWKKEILPKLLYPLFGFLRSMGKTPYPGFGDNVEGDYDFLNGSLYLLRTAAFVKAGMFDPNTFLYSEEPILAARIKKIGFRVYYFNKVKVIHEYSITERILSIHDVTAKYHYDSNRYFQKEYQKISVFGLLMFDLSYYVFMYVWKPLIVGSIVSSTIKRLTRWLSSGKPAP